MSEILTLRFLECKRASLYNNFSVRYSVAKEAGTMNIGEQIKARRIETGMTQQDMADRLQRADSIRSLMTRSQMSFVRPGQFPASGPLMVFLLSENIINND